VLIKFCVIPIYTFLYIFSALCFQELHTSEMSVIYCDVGYVQSQVDVKLKIHKCLRLQYDIMRSGKLCICNFLEILFDQGLVVRVSGYRYRGPEFDPRRYQIF
jgi:hypothetical protein